MQRKRLTNPVARELCFIVVSAGVGIAIAAGPWFLLMYIIDVLGRIR